MDDARPAFDVEPHLAALDRDGYTIIPAFLDAATLAAVRAGLAPHLDTHQGRNDFEGYRTERVYTLVARGKVFEALTEDVRVLAILDRLLQPGYLLTASQAISIGPGETPQPIHADDVFYRVPRPRPAISISTIVAVDAFTADNGGTEIIPGSHRWTDEQIAGIYYERGDAVAQQALERQLIPLQMPAGACVVFLGTLLHRGGRGWHSPTSTASPGRARRRTSISACRRNWRARCRRGCSRCSATTSGRHSWAMSPPRIR